MVNLLYKSQDVLLLVNTTALVDQMTGGGGLAGIDVADNDDIDMNLFFTVEM